MLWRMAFGWQLCLFLFPLCLMSGNSLGQSSLDSAALLPESSVVVIQVEPFEELLSHPLRKKLVSSKAFKTLWNSQEILKLRGGITLVELALGDRLEKLATRLTDGGMVLAIDAKTRGAVAIVQSESQDWLRDYVDRLVKLARDDAKNKGRADPVHAAMYRDVQAYEINKVIFGVLGDRLVVTNQGELGKAIVDRWKNPDGEKSLPGKESYRRALEDRSVTTYTSGTHAIGWMYVDVHSLREAGLAKELLGGKAKDFGAELILGGLLAVLHKTPYVTGNLKLQDSRIHLHLSSPNEPAWVGQDRVYFVGDRERGGALPLWMPEGALAGLTTFRDVSQLWLRAGDLFDQDVNDKLAQADNTLTTLFSGRDFGEDILGAVHPEIRLIAARQQYGSAGPVPAIQLPAMALVARLKDPGKMRPELKRIFQSFIGFLNIVGAMEGRTQLDLDMESSGKVQFYWATHVPEVDRQGTDEAPIQFNFSPCLAFMDDWMVLSSTQPLARQLTSLPQPTEKPNAASAIQKGPQRTNTALEIDLHQLNRVLEDNRRQLVSQNVLEKGHTRQEAEKEIGMLLSIVGLLERTWLSLAFEKQVTLDLSAQWAVEP
jgi:hypothetical protein